MNISYNWLKEYLDFSESAEEVAEILTGAGLEVEAIEKFESVKGGLEGLKIGLVKSVEKHPDADKLSFTKVNVGDSTDLQIVCGAPNVAAGQKVIVATEGTIIHPFTGEPFKIKKTKIRGVASEGMICAADEIGLSADHSGIMVLPDDAIAGTAAKDFLKVETDAIFQIGLTPNRGDAMSHIGVDRDLSACLAVNKNSSSAIKIPSVEKFPITDNSYRIDVEVENTEACPRFSGFVISGIEVRESPDWLKNKLSAVGLRPINNIVDITNFVMLECGQPLHAYDADEIAGRKVIVKTMADGTAFRTLDDKNLILRNTDLMVCSSTEPMCMAGVFGGLGSGVKEITKNIFLEAAYWNPKWIRRTSTFHNLKTDAASRFEKGTDPNGTIYALKRAAMLMCELSGGTVASEIVDIYPEPVKEKQISLSWEKLNRIAGIDVPHLVAKKILKSLSFDILSEDDAHIAVVSPTFKTDIACSEDVIEEVLRIYGYDKIPVPDAVRSSISFSTGEKKEAVTEDLSAMLAAMGFSEMINNSISNSKYQEEFFPGMKESVVRLLSYSNAGLDSLRTSMLFPALEVVHYNHNRKQHNLKLFEFGKTYMKEKDRYVESSHLILLITGSWLEESWQEKQVPADFYFMKGVVDNILKKSGIRNFLAEPFINEIWEQGLKYRADQMHLASFGKLNQRVASAFDIKKEVYYAELNADTLLKLAGNDISFTALPKFPPVRRDIALVVDHHISFREIEELAYKSCKNILKEVNLFDVYSDEKMGADKKSYAVSFLFLDEKKTLTDEEVEKMIAKMTEQFQSQLNAHIRT